MKLRLTSLVAFLIPVLALARPAPQVIHLWPNGAPGFEKLKDIPERAHSYWVRDVNNPSITVFRPDPAKSNGCAVVVAPGGGFRELVFDAEGKQVADYLNPLGVTVFVLKYRLPNAPHSPYTLANVHQDAFRAMRLVRSRAAEFGVDPHRIGFLGFSAGGQIATMLAFSPGAGKPKSPDPIDRADARPDFVMMVYPGGGVPKVVPPYAPPAFLLAADDDEYGCDKVALAIYEKYREAGISVEAHFIAQGKHAFNMGNRSRFLAIRHWPDRMADWLADRGFLTPPAH